jgi:hypothetical protein
MGKEQGTMGKNPIKYLTKAINLIVQQIKVNIEAKRTCFLLLVSTSTQIYKRVISSLITAPERLTNTEAINNIRRKKWVIMMTR